MRLSSINKDTQMNAYLKDMDQLISMIKSTKDKKARETLENVATRFAMSEQIDAGEETFRNRSEGSEWFQDDCVERSRNMNIC